MERMILFFQKNIFYYIVATSIPALFLLIVVSISVNAWMLNRNRKKIDLGLECKSDDYYKSEYIMNGVLELIVCSTCIWGAVCMYEYLSIVFEAISSILLIFIILLANIINRIIDKNWTNKVYTEGEYSKDDLRLSSSLIVLILIIILKLFFNTANLKNILLIYICLVLGRFVFFDFSIKEIKRSLTAVISCLPCIISAIPFYVLIFWSGIRFHVIEPEHSSLTILIVHILFIFLLNITLKIYDNIV